MRSLGIAALVIGLVSAVYALLTPGYQPVAAVAGGGLFTNGACILVSEFTRRRRFRRQIRSVG